MKTVLVCCFALLVPRGQHKGYVYQVNAFDLLSPNSATPSYAFLKGSRFCAASFFDSYHDSESGSSGIDDPYHGHGRSVKFLTESLVKTENLLDSRNKKIIRLAAELSKQKTLEGLVLNIRPILQKRVTDWYLKRYRPKGKLVAAAAFKSFAGLLNCSETGTDDHYDKLVLEDAITDAVKHGQVDGAVRENVEKLIEKMWFLLSDLVVPTLTGDPLTSAYRGYVVSGSGDFSAAVSAMLRFFYVEHIVMSPGYETFRYWCSSEGETIEEDWEEDEEFQKRLVTSTVGTSGVR